MRLILAAIKTKLNLQAFREYPTPTNKYLKRIMKHIKTVNIANLKHVQFRQITSFLIYMYIQNLFENKIIIRERGLESNGKNT